MEMGMTMVTPGSVCGIAHTPEPWPLEEKEEEISVLHTHGQLGGIGDRDGTYYPWNYHVHPDCNLT